jgi:hypothetical protein
VTMTGNKAGTVIVNAVYGGDSNNLGSSGTCTLRIRRL